MIVQPNHAKPFFSAAIASLVRSKAVILEANPNSKRSLALWSRLVRIQAENFELQVAILRINRYR